MLSLLSSQNDDGAAESDQLPLRPRSPSQLEEELQQNNLAVPAAVSEKETDQPECRGS